MAYVLDVYVELLDSFEGPSMGAAMLAMVACGEYKDVESAAEDLIRVAKVITPDDDISRRYEEKYQHFKKLYPSLKTFFGEGL